MSKKKKRQQSRRLIKMREKGLIGSSSSFGTFMVTFVIFQTDASEFFNDDIIVMTKTIDTRTKPIFQSSVKWIWTHFVSNRIKFWSTGTSMTPGSQALPWSQPRSSWRENPGMDGRLKWVKVNGYSIAKSLQTRRIMSHVQPFRCYSSVAMIFTFTLYCTMMPRFCFCVILRILNRDPHIHIRVEERKAHIVDEARSVSSCFNFPSKGKPRLSLLLAKSGDNE